MNEIRWKRGVPTDEECRECVIASGGTDTLPELKCLYFPNEVRKPLWSDQNWYAAVRILQPLPGGDPEEMVTQDRVIARDGIDQERWVDKHGTPTGGWKPCNGCSLYHGDTGGTDFRLELRCRRKDLPPLPEPVIREFRNTETEGPQPRQWWQSPSGESKDRLFIVGRRIDGRPYVENAHGCVFGVTDNWNGWHHLPDCTGWDWQPPKKTKTQRKWVKTVEAWHNDDEGPLMNGWSRTDETREVPL